MANVWVEMRGHAECPTCGHEFETDPCPKQRQTVVCSTCGASHRVKGSGYPVVDWNKRNRQAAKEVSAQRA